VFRFDDRFGADEITDFAVGDTLDFTLHSTVKGMGDLVITSRDGSAVISDGMGGSVILRGVVSDQLIDTDFLF